MDAVSKTTETKAAPKVNRTEEQVAAYLKKKKVATATASQALAIQTGGYVKEGKFFHSNHKEA